MSINPQWAVVQAKDHDFHAVPVDDTRKHSLANNCWCNPRYLGGNGVGTDAYGHNSADGRENYEQGKKPS